MNVEVKGLSGTDDHICIVSAENSRQWDRGELGVPSGRFFGWHGGREQMIPSKTRCEDTGRSVAGHVEVVSGAKSQSYDEQG